MRRYTQIFRDSTKFMNMQRPGGGTSRSPEWAGQVPSDRGSASVDRPGALPQYVIHRAEFRGGIRVHLRNSCLLSPKSKEMAYPQLQINVCEPLTASGRTVWMAKKTMHESLTKHDLIGCQSSGSRCLTLKTVFHQCVIKFGSFSELRSDRARDLFLYRFCTADSAE